VEEVKETWYVTRRTTARSVWPEEVGVGRNRRRNAAAEVGEKRPCRRFEAREGDSLDEEVLLVLLGRRGRLCSGGAMGCCGGGARTCTQERKRREEKGFLVAAR
jgi:hypothetical protein